MGQSGNRRGWGYALLTLASGAVAALVAGGTPAQACPSGPRPLGNDARYIAACAGEDDHVVLIRPASGDDAPGFAVSARSSVAPNEGSGMTVATAGVSATAKFLFNPDLHATVIGEVTADPHGTSGGGGYANAQFRDIVTFNGAFLSRFWSMDFVLEGILQNSTDPRGGTGKSAVAFNLGIENLNDSALHAVVGIALTTQEGIEGEINVEGEISLPLSVGMNINGNTPYIVRGDLDVVALATAFEGMTENFAADFGSTAKFNGFRFFTDETMTTEVFDVQVTSAFGFDYSLTAPVTNDVPEPASIALLATAIGLAAAARRRSTG